MAAETRTDKGIGLAALLSLIAAGGALVVFLNPDRPIAGWGFALAMVAASLAVVAVQAYA